MVRIPTSRDRNPVQALHVELLLRLEGHEAHRRTCGGLGDRFGITVVVLLRLHVGADILGRHQSDGMSLRGQQPPKVMGAAAGLHRDDTSGQLGRRADDRLTPCATTQNHRTGWVEANQATAVFAEIDTQHGDRTLCHSRSLHSSKAAACHQRFGEGRAIP